MQVEGCFASDCRVSVDLAHGVSDGQRLSLYKSNATHGHDYHVNITQHVLGPHQP